MRVASTPVEVERTFERWVMFVSVLELKREGWVVKGSWVALSEDMVVVDGADCGLGCWGG